LCGAADSQRIHRSALLCWKTVRVARSAEPPWRLRHPSCVSLPVVAHHEAAQPQRRDRAGLLLHDPRPTDGLLTHGAPYRTTRGRARQGVRDGPKNPGQNVTEGALALAAGRRGPPVRARVGRALGCWGGPARRPSTGSGSCVSLCRLSRGLRTRTQGRCNAFPGLRLELRASCVYFRSAGRAAWRRSSAAAARTLAARRLFDCLLQPSSAAQMLTPPASLDPCEGYERVSRLRELLCGSQRPVRC